MNFKEMTIQEAIAFEVEVHGSMRAAAKSLGIDVGYLSRLSSGEKDNPGDYVLEQLRLEKRVIYVRPIINYEPTPLTPRTKCA
jgi:hypothetical protein